MSGSERYPPDARLARASDIRRCLDAGRRHRTEHLDMIWMDNAFGRPRLGLIVPKAKRTAPERNRLRRRLREVWRRELQPRLPAWDLVIRARLSAYDQPFDALRAALLGFADARAPRA
ncbi:MAG: ribonuclease P protein component [Gemmatimonadales bacterium]|nr:ribonuclease P protein component [Gemmatimonadales bacterium]